MTVPGSVYTCPLRLESASQAVPEVCMCLVLVLGILNGLAFSGRCSVKRKPYVPEDRAA